MSNSPTLKSHSSSRNRVLFLLSLTILVCRLLARDVLFIYDDAFITFRYAHNLASGVGLVYNAGERVLGTTSPGYAIILSLFDFAHIAIPAAAVYLNSALDIAIFLLCARLFLRDSPNVLLAFFGAICAVSPLMNRVAVGGMELSLFVALSLVAIYLFTQGKRSLAFVVAPLLYFIRPEAVVLTAVLCLWEVRERGWKQALTSAAIAAITIALPLAFAYNYYGHVVSQSILAKSTRAGSTIPEVLAKFFAPDPLSIALLPFFAVGVLAFRRLNDARRILIIWIFAYLLLYCIGRPYIASWYGELFFVGIPLTAVFGLEVLAAKSAALRRIVSISYVLPAVAVVLWAYLYVTESPSAVQTGIHSAVKEWSAKNITNKSSIAARDIGVIGFYSNAYVHDLDGLVSPDMLKYHSIEEAVRTTSPTYVYLAGEGEEIAHLDYKAIAHFTGTTNTKGSLLGHSWLAHYTLLSREAVLQQNRQGQ